MKVEKIIKSTIEYDIDILGATLLTVDEAEQLPGRLRAYDEFWWVRSSGRRSSRIANARYTVRPVLIISNLESSNFQIGDTLKFGDREFEIISDDKAFCLTDIGTTWFREDSEADDANDYEKSDVKKYVDNWFKKVKETKE